MGPSVDTVDTAWTSPDGQFIAASGQGRSIYVWNAATRSYLTTLTAPNIRIGTTVYTAIIGNVAFSADDSTLTAVLYPNVPSGAPTPGSSSAYAVYQWKLPTGDPTLLWSVQVPATVAFSNDNSTALTSQNNVVSLVTLSPELNTAPSVTLPGGADQAYRPPFELDLTGSRMIYHPASNETYMWDFGKESVVAKLRSSEYTVLSPDGKTILAANPSNYPTPAGGKLDLWSTVTRKYLLTITDPNYRKDGFATAASGGRDVVILSTEKTVNGRDEYRQLSVWATPLA